MFYFFIMKKEILSGLAVLGLLAGCASTDKQSSNEEQVVVEEVKEDAIDVLNKYSQENPVYFAFDSAKTNDKQIVKNYEKYLEGVKAIKDVKISINGYCDKRGSEQYNMVLGQKRAEAVKKALEKVVNNEIEVNVVSYGKNEYKEYSDNVEENYQKNRKVEIIASK